MFAEPSDEGYACSSFGPDDSVKGTGPRHNSSFVPSAETNVTAWNSPGQSSIHLRGSVHELVSRSANSDKAALEGMHYRLKPIMRP